MIEFQNKIIKIVEINMNKCGIFSPSEVKIHDTKIFSY